MISLLKRLLRRKPGLDAPLAPDTPFAAIGDVHGRNDLLQQLLEQLSASHPKLPIVFVGDLVDRGPDSAGVLERVMSLTSAGPDRAICLKGNHEAMILDFLDFPAESGALWMRNGGGKTLASYGIESPADFGDLTALIDLRDTLLARIGEQLVDWMRARPLAFQNGNVAVTHAGGDPTQPIDPRRGYGLLWGHRDFLRKPRKDGIWMVHGHYVSETACARDGRIAIDTGAYATGQLTAAVIAPEEVSFLST